MTKPKDSLEEYTWLCNSLFGAYMDAIWGFHLVKKEATDALKHSKNGKAPFMSYIPRNVNKEDLKSRTNGEMNQKNLNMSRSDEIIKRNQTDGINSNLIAHSIIATIYNYWEDKYRRQISKEFGLVDKLVSSDAIGDIRSLRNSIVHNKGFAKNDVEKAKIFCWFEEGEFIQLDYTKMLFLKNYIMFELYDSCCKENNI